MSVEINNPIATPRSSARQSIYFRHSRATLEKLPSGESPITARESIFGHCRKENPVSEGTTLDLPSSGLTWHCRKIAARRTCDCAETDAELVSLLKLTYCR
jgi:hypothetical protein